MLVIAAIAHSEACTPSRTARPRMRSGALATINCAAADPTSCAMMTGRATPNRSRSSSSHRAWLAMSIPRPAGAAERRATTGGASLEIRATEEEGSPARRVRDIRSRRGSESCRPWSEYIARRAAKEPWLASCLYSPAGMTASGDENVTAFARRLSRAVLTLLAFPSAFAAAPEEAPVAAATAPAAQPLTAADADSWLDGYLPYALKTNDIAGAVVVIVKDGEVLTERGYGYADVAAKEPVDPKLTLFRPGSVSKLFTWTAVMQLVEQGKIDLDADVNQYLDFRIPPREGKPVTMRNLMQHTAGFEEQAKGVISDNPQAPGFEVLLKAWVPQRVFAPGTTPAYSNYGASLAGYIVQRVSGEPFDTYVEKHIFEPLDMKYSSFRQPLPPELAPLMSRGYRTASGEAQPFEIVGPAPAGALSSPGEDMAHFMIAQLLGGEYHGKRILAAATAEMMHNTPLTLLPPLNRMELGFFETNI